MRQFLIRREPYYYFTILPSPVRWFGTDGYILLMDSYAPGLHILATFTAPIPALQDVDACRAFFDTQILAQGLTPVGAAYHAFEEGGFTAVVALTESHLSIHTWPEYGLATFDVFLSNFRRDNADRAQLLYAATLAFFGATEQHKTEVRR